MLYRSEDYIQPLGWILETSRQILSLIQERTGLSFQYLDDDLDSADQSGFHLAQIAIGLDPEPIGIAHVYNLRPYANPVFIRREMMAAASSGWLTRVEPGVYQPSTKSLRIYERICWQMTRVYHGIDSLSICKLQELDDLLAEVVAAIQGPEGLGYKPGFDLDLRLAVRKGSILQRICCKLSHILAYRDDAYVNAWMEQDANSYVWEAFSLIYKGRARNAREIAAELSHVRNYDPSTYWDALDELVERGWLVQKAGIYEPSELGIRTVAQAARSLNQSFYAPLLALGEVGQKRLKSLLVALADGLKDPKPHARLRYSSLNRTIGWGYTPRSRQVVM